MLFGLIFNQPNSTTVAQEMGHFDAAVALTRRVEPTPLPVEWWVTTADKMDVTSWVRTQALSAATRFPAIPLTFKCVCCQCLCSLFGLFWLSSDPTGERRIGPSGAIMDMVVRMLKMNMVDLFFASAAICVHLQHRRRSEAVVARYVPILRHLLVVCHRGDSRETGVAPPGTVGDWGSGCFRVRCGEQVLVPDRGTCSWRACIAGRHKRKWHRQNFHSHSNVCSAGSCRNGQSNAAYPTSSACRS